MTDFWSFLGGASNELLRQQREQEKRDAAIAGDERELAKIRAVEALRRETSDYEYNRNRTDSLKSVDARQSYLDPKAKQYVMVNSEGQVIGRREATSSELLAEEAGRLDIEGKRLENAYKRKATNLLGLDRGGGGGGGGGSKETNPARTKPELHALAARIADSMKDYNLSDMERVAAYTRMKQGIDEGKDEAWLRRFETEFLRTPSVRRGIDTRSRLRAEEAVFGKPKSE